MSDRFSRSPSSALDRFLAEQVESGLYTSLVGWVGTPEAMLWSGAAGALHPGGRPGGGDESDDRVGLDTLFDLASLTKLFTASLALRLDAAGLLALDVPIGEIWSQRSPAVDPRLARCRLEDLLRHRAGFVPWCPLYHLCVGREEVLRLLLGSTSRGSSFLGAAAGTYSDLGVILWGLAAEEVLGEPLRTVLRAHLLDPLGSAVLPAWARTAFGAGPPAAAGVAACIADTGREVELAEELGFAPPPLLPPPAPGEPQDGNARFLGRRRVAFPAHAGLFGGVGDLVGLAKEWLRPGRVLGPTAVARALSGSEGLAEELQGSRVLGWEKDHSGPGFGHSGFTGGGLWVEPVEERIHILLGHRASPHSNLAPARARFRELAGRIGAPGG